MTFQKVTFSKSDFSKRDFMKDWSTNQKQAFLGFDRLFESPAKQLTNIGKSIGKYCGNDKPSNFKSRGNEVIVLHYESGTNDDTFSLLWTANEDVCGEELTASEGVIMSPNYPLAYDSERRCSWGISVQLGRRIKGGLYSKIKGTLR